MARIVEEVVNREIEKLKDTINWTKISYIPTGTILFAVKQVKKLQILHNKHAWQNIFLVLIY
jgi:hypothetical protein